MISSGLNCLSTAQQELRNTDYLTRVIGIIWILLPFLYLIERSPADIGLSLIVLLFIVRSAIRGDWQWMKIRWWQTCFMLAFVAAVSGAASALPLISVFESIAWLRFPLFAVTSAYLLSQYKKTSYLSYVSSCIGIGTMFCILAAEIVVNYDSWSNASMGLGARLYWPYGDPVSGNYLAKFGLACFLVMIAQVKSLIDCRATTPSSIQSGNLLIASSFILGLFIFTLLSGERMNTLIVLCSGGLAVLLVFRNSIKSLAIIFVAAALVFSVVFLSNPYLYLKFTFAFYEQISNLSSSGYWHLWMTGLDAFASAPALGIGPGNFRYLCNDIPSIISSVQRCDNHPHNFLIQIFGETGILGGLIYAAFYLSLIWHLFSCRHKSVFHSVLFIVPLALFFPLKSNADFFGQWNNLMLWYGMAMALNFAEQSEDFFVSGINADDAT